MRVYELRALRRLPAASMLPAGSRRRPPEALHVCRCAVARALTRTPACHMRLCLGRLWDHSKQSSMSLLHAFPCCDTYRTRARTVG